MNTALKEATQKVCLVTFGCQMNKLDSELILGRFREHGYSFTDHYTDACVILFNTCSVRGHAEDRVYSRVGALKQLKKNNPDLVIGVTGCMAQREGEAVFANTSLIDIVCGTREFARLPEFVDEVRQGRKRILATAQEPVVRVQRNIQVRPQKHHAYVVVMRGCNMSCTFCIVPTVRGPVASVPVEEVAQEVERLVADGVKEITLLGQTIDAYGYDLPGKVRLSTLLFRLAEIRGLLRMNLITLHASYVGDDFVAAMRDIPQMSKFLPLPAQSGSERMLKLMKRGYSLAQYRQKIAKLRDAVPNIEFSSDWIVGFPGEEEQDFAQSVVFLQEIGFLSSFVFKFSPRPGTVAAEQMIDSVPEDVKRERNMRLLEVQENVSLQQMRQQVGKILHVLVDQKHEKYPDLWIGKSEYQQRVQFSSSSVQPGDCVKVRIATASAHVLSGIPA